MSELLGPALALGVGLASALVPLVNAEAYALLAAGRGGRLGAAVMVVALAAGQTGGKLVLFEAARRGSRRWRRRGEEQVARWRARIADGLRSRRTAVPLVLASATLGMPPLAAVSLAAGAAGQRRWEFGATCLVGRVVRFGALALPAAWALG